MKSKCVRSAATVTSSSTNVASKFYLVRKSGEEMKKEFSVSPERKYMSSVEIPAEQLEALKGIYNKFVYLILIAKISTCCQRKASQIFSRIDLMKV